MRRTLDDFRVEPAPPKAPPVEDARAQFLGGEQDAALNRRVFGSLLVCAALVGAAVLLVS